MLVFLAPDRVAKSVRSAATNQFCALSAAMSSIAKNPAHKSWKLLKNHSLLGGGRHHGDIAHQRLLLAGIDDIAKFVIGFDGHFRDDGLPLHRRATRWLFVGVAFAAIGLVNLLALGELLQRQCRIAVFAPANICF